VAHGKKCSFIEDKKKSRSENDVKNNWTISKMLCFDLFCFVFASQHTRKQVYNAALKIALLKKIL
jgi:hypothetical protein